MYVLEVSENQEKLFHASELLECLKSAEHSELELRSDLLEKLKGWPDGKRVSRTIDTGDCFKVEKGTDEQGEPTLKIKTSFYVGVDWLVPGLLALRVVPKLDSEHRRVDVFQTARIAFEFAHRSRDIEVLLWLADRDTPIIRTSDENGLLLFLISEYLLLIRSIVRKGLKCSFYTREENFRYRVKGKILLSKTVQHLRSHDPFANVYCVPQHFDVDTPENRFLKFVLKKCLIELQRVLDRCSVEHLINSAKVCLRAFVSVGDSDDAARLKAVKVNPVYSEYSVAYRLGLQIIRLEDTGVRVSQSKQHILPYWINMALLFELYVYAKMAKTLGSNVSIEYQLCKKNGGRLDFLVLADPKIHACGCFIADAKYKPRYDDINVLLEDARQVSGYARLSDLVRSVDAVAGENWNRFIPCLLVYPSWLAESDQFEADPCAWKKIERYEKMFKVKLRLPELQILSEGDKTAA